MENGNDIAGQKVLEVEADTHPRAHQRYDEHQDSSQSEEPYLMKLRRKLTQSAVTGQETTIK